MGVFLTASGHEAIPEKTDGVAAAEQSLPEVHFPEALLAWWNFPPVNQKCARQQSLHSVLLFRMSTHSSQQQPEPRRRGDLTVPRDPQTQGDRAPRNEITPPAGSVNPPDEAYATTDKPLPPDSPEGAALHRNPPRAKGELAPGSAGDSARPTKDGIFHKPIPPHGNL
jgi:hypothetical protein